MSDNKYLAFNAAEWEHRKFETQEEAEKWLQEEAREYDDGIPQEFIDGESFVAKITHRTQYCVTDKKENYTDKEEWPYSDDFEHVGNIEFNAV